MSIPGFTADLVLEVSVRSRQQGSSEVQQGPIAIVPALHTEEWYHCYTRADGHAGWCGTICDDNVCHYVVD